MGLRHMSSSHLAQPSLPRISKEGELLQEKMNRLTHCFEEIEKHYWWTWTTYQSIAIFWEHWSRKLENKGHGKSCRQRKNNCLNENSIKIPNWVLNVSYTKPSHGPNRYCEKISMLTLIYDPIIVCLQIQKKVIGGLKYISETNKSISSNTWKQGCRLGEGTKCPNCKKFSPN